MWFKIFMGVSIPALAIGWLAYWLWQRKLDKEEAQTPKEEKSSERLKQTRNEVSDWAKQMANFKKPTGPSNAPGRTDGQ